MIKKKQFNQLDCDNLIEELNDLGRAVIRHLLLIQYWTKEAGYNTIQLQGEIYTFRTQLKRKMTKNLRNFLDSELNSIYQDALGFVKIKTENSVNFPSECPYSLDELLNFKDNSNKNNKSS